MKQNKIYFLLVILILNLHASKIQKHFNYFGNIMLSKLSDDGFTLNNYNHDNINNDTSLTPLSKLGAQLTLIKDNYTFTAQTILQKNHGKYRTNIPWLNIKYDYDNYTIRLGRIQTTLLLSSDSIDIDYIHLWAKAPDEVYRIMSIKSFDGLELIYNNTYNNYDYSITLTPIGQITTNINTIEKQETKEIMKNAHAFKLNIIKDNFEFQTSYTKANLDLPNNDNSSINTVRNALKALGNDVQRYSYKDKKFSSFTIGLNYNNDRYILNSEFTKLKINSLLPDMTAYYVLFGIRYNNITPYIIYSKNENDKEHFNTKNIQAPANLKTALNDILYLTNTSQETTTIGFKYDIKVGISLKCQIDRTITSNYGQISQNAIEQSGYERHGILGRFKNVQDKPIHTYIVGVSFAF